MDDALKQRLVGAAVLGVAAVIGIPALLGEPAPSPERDAPPAAGVPRPTPRPAELAAPAGQTQPQAAPAPAEPRPAESPPARAAKTAPAAAPQGRESTRAAGPSSAAATGWHVQVATFSERANAEALYRQLRAADHRTEVVKDGSYWRVVVGPYAGRDAAERGRTRLARLTGLAPVLRRAEGP